MRVESAEAALQLVNLVPHITEVSSEMPVGTVVEQSPDAGSKVVPNTVIELSVSKGTTITTVPNVVGQDKDAATSTLEDSGFKVRVLEKDVADPDSDNIVLAEDPKAGDKAKTGTTVTITIGQFA
jgi:serine/threonine-protein kinase